MGERLPLRDAYGQVIAHATVDAEDYERLAAARWRLHPAGYAFRKSSTTRERNATGRPKTFMIYMHREVLGLVRGDGLETDHINRDKLDNRRANLRVITHAQNAQNLPSQAGSSRYRGVTWDNEAGRWMAQGWVDGTRYHIGRFRDEDEAGAAAAAWRSEHMPYSVEAT